MGNAKSIEEEPAKASRNTASTKDKRSHDGRRISKTSRISRSSLSSQGSSTTLKKAILPLAQRQIVKGCMDNAKDDIADRIYRRIYEKRDDFKTFVDALNEAQKAEMVESLREFLFRVVEQLSDNDEVQRISEEFGIKHVQFRNQGFRPDFFSITADAVTTECCFLDAAVHQSYETVTAWSTLTSVMFSAVRDGYYNELRKQRRASTVIPTIKPRNSLDTTAIDGRDSLGEHCRRGSRSISPMDTGANVKKESVDSIDKTEANSFLRSQHELRGY